MLVISHLITIFLYGKYCYPHCMYEGTQSQRIVLVVLIISYLKVQFCKFILKLTFLNSYLFHSVTMSQI
jgi:hypothetical protein